MDILRLNPDTWMPDELVEGFFSKIWTERYQACGEFEFHSRKIDQVKSLIPVGSFIGERNSQEVMIVENHNIEDDEDGPHLVTTGRTFESFFERRSTIIVKPTAGETAMWTYAGDDIYPTDAAKALIESHVTISADAPIQKVPGTAVENLITTHKGNTMSYENSPGELYQQVLGLLRMEAAGIRNQLDFNGSLKIYIYFGVNRTVGQTANEPVIFSLPAEHLVNPKYLFTIKDYRNVAYVVGTYWQQRVYAPGVDTGISGLDRKILYVDVGDDIKQAYTDARKTRIANARGLAALADHNKTLFFDGEVSPKSPYIRGRDYNLGDKVTLMAKYGVSQTMLVNEYTRTEDEEGEKSYPTLITPSDL
jgi:hypothetical protein